MADSERRLILANGEKLVGVIEKETGFRTTDLPRTYDEARERVIGQLTTALEHAARIPSTRRYPEEVVLCMRLHPDMLAKSYEPEALFLQVPELRNVGSRNWRTETSTVAQTERIKKQRAKGLVETVGRLLFVQGAEAGFRQLLNVLDRSPQVLRKKFMEDIRKLEAFDLLKPEEQLQGFGAGWKHGRVELVLHPTVHGSDLQRDFLRTLFADLEVPKKAVRTAFYADGGTAFVSAPLTRAVLSELAGCNPLRTAHPLQFSEPQDLRNVPTIDAPPPPGKSSVSTIKVGIFDGGIDPTSVYLNGFAEEDSLLSIKTPRDPKYVSHGTAVAGAALYGPLERHEPKKPLPAPPVSIVSIRALPTSDPLDFDLYEAIDIIEAAVPARPDIKVFNISFGPKGEILDDSISRFTFALDRLTVTNKVTFCVAVGNDGDIPESRIQSPADAVHALAVGAFTVRSRKKTRAEYSCIGPGREGAKMKPDITAFGGCTLTPMHLVSTSAGKKALACGTSFASPIASSLCAQAHGLYDRATALLTRCLVTHSAEHPGDEPDFELGNGCIPDDVDGVLKAPKSAVTVAFQGQLSPRSYYRLPIPIPEKITLPGMVRITWTIAALCPIEMAHPSDYTACCIEDAFYPHSEFYNFSYESKSKTKKKEVRRLHLAADKAEILKLGTDWKKAQFPCTKSGNRYPTEHEQRTVEYKWDTLVRRSVSMRGTSLHQPFLVLHAIGRHKQVDRFDYAAAVTISAPKHTGDLYSEIVTRYPVLQPIRLRTEAEIRVTV